MTQFQYDPKDIFAPPKNEAECLEQLRRRKRHPFRKQAMEFLCSDWYLPEDLLIHEMRVLTAAIAAHSQGNHSEVEKCLQELLKIQAQFVVLLPLLTHHASRSARREAKSIKMNRELGTEKRERVIRLARGLSKQGTPPRSLVSTIFEESKSISKNRIRQILQDEGILPKRGR